METSEVLNTLSTLPLGARLVVRSKTDWRTAVLCRMSDERVVLSVSSPTGRTYRLHRAPDCEITFDGLIPILKIDAGDTWRDNFSAYDVRW